MTISENKIYPRTGDTQVVYLKNVIMWQFELKQQKRKEKHGGREYLLRCFYLYK